MSVLNFNNDESNKRIKLNLTSKDGRNAELEGSKKEVLDLLLDLGFGPDLPQKHNITIPSTSSNSNNSNRSTSYDLQDMSKIERIKILIRSLSSNPGHWFTSKDILSMYEKFIDEPISLSTVSTYLSRLEGQGILQKRGSKKDLEYSLLSDQLELVPQYDFLEKRFISINKRNK